MKTKPYPIVSLRPFLKSDIDLDFEGITYAQVSCDCDFPPIAIKRLCKDGIEKLCFANGIYKGWFTNVELRTLEQSNSGKILNVYGSYQWQDTFNPFDRYVSDFHNKKNEAEKTNSPKRMLYKIMLNSLSGKFGEHGKSRFFSLNNGKLFNEMQKDGKTAWYHNVVLAAYITAYARLHLWNILKNLNPQKAYYCDTDSVWTSEDLSNKTGDKLGQLKLEHSVEPYDACFIRSKFYMFNDRVIMKGFTVKSTPIDIMTAIFRNDFKRFEHRIAKVLEAQRIHKEVLSDYYIIKRFSIEPDGKRLYERELSNETLLIEHTASVPLEVKEYV
jgi:hypothetical protein